MSELVISKNGIVAEQIKPKKKKMLLNFKNDYLRFRVGGRKYYIPVVSANGRGRRLRNYRTKAQSACDYAKKVIARYNRMTSKPNSIGVPNAGK